MSNSWPTAPRPSVEAVREREQVLSAAADGRIHDVRQRLQHSDERVRATAFSAISQSDALDAASIGAGCADESERVRTVLAEAASKNPQIPLRVLLADEHPRVVEAACWAAGERGNSGADSVPTLIDIATQHEDALCREAAVAALGAIGDPSAVDTILEATRDKATVRRRAIIALAPYDSPRVTAALEHALEDRDWQVRQAAEDLLAEQR